jgi:UDP-N-acetylglucosamine--N-acetylmuramyl-(pentapeptide) pyrophosphoryl-undecaprenol N-acetylglucosamine transferase
VPAALGLLPEGTAVEVRHQCGRNRVDATQAAYDSAGIGETVGANLVREPATPVPNKVRSYSANSSAGAEKSAPTHQPASTVQVTEFIDDMAAAYAWADLVICRAGALTVSEVAAAGLPAIFVPFPHAVDDHQTKNAGYLVDSGGGLLLPEAAASPGALAELLSSLAADRGRLLEMATQARACAVPDAARRVADLCMEYAAA